MTKKNLNLAVAVILAAASGLAMADPVVIPAPDITSLTTAITNIGIALVAITVALTTMSISVFAVAKVYRFISKKAGA